MRVLGIETSTRRGSVALFSAGHVRSLEHEEPNAHAEQILPLVEQALSEAGWQREELSQVAVGVGPGSFTGLRVGIALAEGLALGLGIPLLGVSSLRALAHAVPSRVSGVRVPMLDARRNEAFVAAYDAEGTELLAPRAVAAASLGGFLHESGLEQGVLVGAFAEKLEGEFQVHRGAGTEFPHAREIAELAANDDPALCPPVPQYVRGPNLIKPKLVTSPLAEAPSLDGSFEGH